MTRAFYATLAGVVLFAALFALLPAAADEADNQVDVCSNGAKDLRVRACTWVIHSGQFEAGPAFYNRGKAYEEIGRLDLAIQDFDQTIALKPDDANAFSARCFARAQQGKRFDSALSDCNKALELSPNTTDPLETRSFVYLRMGNYSAAISDDDAALAIEPKDVDALYIRGLAKRKFGDTAGGNADIVAAKIIDPKIADIYVGYGVTP